MYILANVLLILSVAEEETHVAFHKSLNVLYFTGDLNEFNNSIPDEDVVKVVSVKVSQDLFAVMLINSAVLQAHFCLILERQIYRRPLPPFIAPSASLRSDHTLRDIHVLPRFSWTEHSKLLYHTTVASLLIIYAYVCAVSVVLRIMHRSNLDT